MLEPFVVVVVVATGGEAADLGGGVGSTLNEEFGELDSRGTDVVVSRGAGGGGLGGGALINDEFVEVVVVGSTTGDNGGGLGGATLKEVLGEVGSPVDRGTGGRGLGGAWKEEFGVLRVDDGISGIDGGGGKSGSSLIEVFGEFALNSGRAGGGLGGGALNEEFGALGSVKGRGLGGGERIELKDEEETGSKGVGSGALFVQADFILDC